MLVLLSVAGLACGSSGLFDTDVAATNEAGVQATVQAKADIEAMVESRVTEELAKIPTPDHIVVERIVPAVEEIEGKWAEEPPETSSTNKPYEYGGIADTACLDKWGTHATAYARRVLNGQTVEVELDPEAGLRGSRGVVV